jgi:hypothetical protein
MWFSGHPLSSTCAFRYPQPINPSNAIAVSSSGVLDMIYGVKSKSTLQLSFDCRDNAGNTIQLSSSSSIRISSFVLAAPRSSSDPVWCCNQNDILASVTQDSRDHAFIASASFTASGDNFVVPAVISAGQLFLHLTLKSTVRAFI